MEQPNRVSRRINPYGKYFGTVMAIIYVGMGVFVIIRRRFLGYLNDDAWLLLGIILIGYGVYRGYRTFRTAKNEQIE